MPYTCNNQTVYFYGEDNDVPQNYKVIHEDLKAKKKLFEDDQFPAVDSSLYFKEKPDFECVWKRPGEIDGNPKFMVNGASRFDIKQGDLGDCWLLAGMANLTTHPELQSFVVPSHQSFTDNYAGIFQFRLWRQGRWIDVVVDDRLPTIISYGKPALVYARSTEQNEFWTALLEKAYAKLFGSYEAIIGGLTIESMVDLSGGVPEILWIKNQTPNHLFDVLQKAHARKDWLTSSILSDTNIDKEDKKNQTEQLKKDYGLLLGHAYTVTGVRIVKSNDKGGMQKLLRIRNPWGNELEWKKAYAADNSDTWKHVSKLDRKEMNLEFQNNGEFWMHLNDFMKHFTNVEICYLSPDIFCESPNEYGKHSITTYHGSWNTKDGTAGGGSQENIEMFNKNPQYTVILRDPDECSYENDEVETDAKKQGASNDGCTLIVSLMQKNRRIGKKDKLDMLWIGFNIYQIPDQKKRSKQDLSRFLKTHAPLYSSGNRTREFSARFREKPGTYLIIPMTQEPNQEADFMLRILTEKPIDSNCI